MMDPLPNERDTEVLVNRIAHALRNPVFAAALQAELAATRSPDPALEKVSNHLNRLNEMINEMLLFGRPVQIDLKNVDPASILEELAASAAKTFPERRADLRIEGKSESVTAFWDPRAVAIILERLLRNSIENSPPSSPVTITISRPAEDEIEISISDRGSGISAELSDHIFEPFFPQHHGRPGLGLAIALKFTRALGGSIEVAPNPGGGTRAAVRLPLRAKISDS